MQHKFLHPLTSSSISNLVALTSTYGCDLKFVPWLLYLGLTCTLRQPFAWLEFGKFHKAVAQQRIEPAPIFIVGHWRSGTTYLQNLMSQDPQFGRVTLLQAAMPREFLIIPKNLIPRFQKMLPPTRLMDNVAVSTDAPWEEEMALTSFGRLSFYHVSFFPRAIERIFREAVLFNDGDEGLKTEWQRQYLHFLRKVQMVQPDRPLLLKNPANTARISILREIFPGARFIHIHRDPYKVFASTVHLYLKAHEAWGLHKSDRDQVVRHVLKSYSALMKAYFTQREELNDEELVEVSFKNLQQDPLGTLSTIYEKIKLDGYDAAAPTFRRYVDGQRSYRKNALTLQAGEKQQVGQCWSDAFVRLGYSV